MKGLDSHYDLWTWDLLSPGSGEWLLTSPKTQYRSRDSCVGATRQAISALIAQLVHR